MKRLLLYVWMCLALLTVVFLWSASFSPPPDSTRSGFMGPVEPGAFSLAPEAFAQGVGQRGTTSVGFSPNDTSTGTTQFLLAKLAAGKAIKALTSDTAIPLYVVVSTTAITGDAVYVIAGPTACVMDATNASGVSGQPVIASITTAGRCHTQAALPAAGYVIGYMADDSTTAGSTAKINALNQASFPATGAGSGTVTSATLSMPTEFSVATPTITTTGTFTVSKATQAANLVYAGPVSGGVAAPTFRALVTADIPAAAPGGSAGGSLGGTYPNPTVINAPGAFAFTGAIRPTALSGNVADYSPTGAATNAVWYLDGGTADRTISGLLAGGSQEVKWLVNIGTTNAIQLLNQNTGSAATGRFLLPGDIYIAPGDVQPIIYDPSPVSRWRPFGPALLEAHRIKACNLGAGSPDPSAAPLSATDAINDTCPNDTGRDQDILTVSCMANNTGVVLRPILTGGSATSILTGTVTCGNGTWADGTVQTTRPIVHSYSGTGNTCAVTPCSIGNTWTTTGLATELKIKIKMRLR